MSTPSPYAKLVRLLYAQAAAPIRHENGRIVSSRSKTGDPKCSQAMSDWKRHGQAKGSETALTLARCRAMAKAMKSVAAMHNSGKTGAAQVLEKRLATGAPLTAKDRKAAAKALRARRAEMGATGKRGTTAAQTRLNRGMQLPAPAPAADPLAGLHPDVREKFGRLLKRNPPETHADYIARARAEHAERQAQQTRPVGEILAEHVAAAHRGVPGTNPELVRMGAESAIGHLNELGRHEDARKLDQAWQAVAHMQGTGRARGVSIMRWNAASPGEKAGIVGRIAQEMGDDHSLQSGMDAYRRVMGDEPAAPAPPPAPAPAPAGPYNLERHGDVQKRLAAGEMTADELRGHYEDLLKHEPALRAELNGRTLKQLAPGGTGGLKKGEVVDRILSNMKHRFAVGGSFQWSPMTEQFDDALRRHLSTVTDEQIKGQAAQRQAARQEAVKALTNPETADEFRRFVEVKGESALSPEQRAKWDDLQAEARRGRDAARAATVAPVRGTPSGLSVTLHQTTHSRKGTPLHVAVLNQRVERDQYDELNRKAKALGGYYSSFRGAGAIPGFQFPSMEAAEKFRDLVGGTAADLSDEQAARAEDRQQSAAERLKTLAENLRGRAEEELSRDRLTNTARRAGMAAGIEARARAQVAHARTLEAIAEGMESGRLKHLNGVRNATDVQTLDRVLRDARWARFHAAQKEQPKAHHDWERFAEAPHGEEDVGAAAYPYPRMWASDLRSAAREFADEPGLKRIAQRIEKAGTLAPKFMTQGSGYKFSGGSLHDPATHPNAALIGAPAGKHVRVHQSYDWRLAQQGQGHGPFYTADKGKSFGTSPEIAVQAALRRGHGLDLVDAPQDELLTLDHPHDIEALGAAAKRLRNHPDRRKQAIGADLAQRLEHYDRLRRADIKTPAELRAALREYLPLKARREAEDPVKAKERALIGRKIEGFFPTPPALVDRLLAAADVRPGHSVLEPSAGKGDIADAVRERHPEAAVETIEPNPSLREILEAKGHALAGRDFLEHTGQHDRIIMNPPFERGQDAQHVRHAYDRLAPGGRIAAIMSEGPFHRQDRASAEFRDWLESVGGESEPLPEGSFAGTDAFRQTGVNTRLVTIQKPHAATNGAAAAAPPPAPAPLRSLYARVGRRRLGRVLALVTA